MSAEIIYWRDIPTQVVVGRGRRAEKRPLADRFMVAVDKAAMHSGAHDTDAYLEAWRRAPAPARDGDWAAETLATSIESDYPATRLAELARNGGWQAKSQGEDA